MFEAYRNKFGTFRRKTEDAQLFVITRSTGQEVNTWKWKKIKPASSRGDIAKKVQRSVNIAPQFKETLSKNKTQPNIRFTVQFIRNDNIGKTFDQFHESLYLHTILHEQNNSGERNKSLCGIWSRDASESSRKIPHRSMPYFDTRRRHVTATQTIKTKLERAWDEDTDGQKTRVCAAAEKDERAEEIFWMVE